ncbi:MAG: VacJ family lipoprotein [Steroidobacteraceae bacterium]
MLIRRGARRALAIVVAAGLSACVTLPPNSPRSPQDPWEPWNRGVYKFNDAIDRGIAKPVARAYVRAVPKPIRTGISNFFSNLNTPTVMINDALQGKFKAAANDLGRFLLNTTVGIGGLLDPATSAGLDRNDEDFGQTLGHWGVHAGPFLELPLLGPSDLRDAPATVVDAYTNPRQYIHNTDVKYGLLLPLLVDRRAALLPYDETLKNVFDKYVFIRDAYLAHRAYLVSDGKITEEPLIDPDAEGSDSSSPPNPKAPAPAPVPAPAPASKESPQIAAPDFPASDRSAPDKPAADSAAPDFPAPDRSAPDNPAADSAAPDFPAPDRSQPH